VGSRGGVGHVGQFVWVTEVVVAGRPPCRRDEGGEREEGDDMRGQRVSDRERGKARAGRLGCWTGLSTQAARVRERGRARARRRATLLGRAEGGEKEQPVCWFFLFLFSKNVNSF
jgi:hypothetical protein